MQAARENVINQLKNLADSHLHIVGSLGYGSYYALYALDNEGVRGPFFYDGTPVMMSKQDYEEALKLIAANRKDEVDGLVLFLIEAGCEPDVEYVFEDMDHEWQDVVYEGIYWLEPQPWEAMDDQALEYWCEVLAGLWEVN